MIEKGVLRAVRSKAAEHRQRREDLDLLVAQMGKLPYGQVKKVLTPEILEVLSKYGYGEGGA